MTFLTGKGPEERKYLKQHKIDLKNGLISSNISFDWDAINAAKKSGQGIDREEVFGEINRMMESPDVKDDRFKL